MTHHSGKSMRLIPLPHTCSRELEYKISDSLTINLSVSVCVSFLVYEREIDCHVMDPQNTQRQVAPSSVLKHRKQKDLSLEWNWQTLDRSINLKFCTQVLYYKYGGVELLSCFYPNDESFLCFSAVNLNCSRCNTK